MKFLKKLFNRHIKMLGRAGIVFKYDGKAYFINSECLIGPPYDVVIFTDDVYYYDKGKKGIKLSNEEKKIILNKATMELESMGMSVDVSPPL